MAFGVDTAKWICVSTIDVTQLGVAAYLAFGLEQYTYAGVLLALILPQVRGAGRAQGKVASPSEHGIACPKPKVRLPIYSGKHLTFSLRDNTSLSAFADLLPVQVLPAGPHRQ